MRASDAIRYFGSRQKLCQALGAKYARVAHWENRDGDRVPLRVALQLQTMTRGKLKLDPSIYEPGAK